MDFGVKIAIFAGGIFGLMVILGGVMLWLRRMFNKRVRAASRWMDINILGWLILTATLPGVPLYLAHGFERTAGVEVTMPDGVAIACVAMEKPIGG